MNIYVASSWRNTFQPEVVSVLREDGHTVYDFKDSEGFHWTEVDGGWQSWPGDIPKYLKGLNHPCAERGFNRDMAALRNCDVCVYVMPCGVSASLEAGWAKGAGKPLIVYVPGLREPDLMVKMADLVTDDLRLIRATLRKAAPLPPNEVPSMFHGAHWEYIRNQAHVGDKWPLCVIDLAKEVDRLNGRNE